MVWISRSVTPQMNLPRVSAPERALYRLGRRQPPLSQQIRARAFQPSVTMPQFFGIEIPKGEVRFRPVFPRVQSRFPRPPPSSAR